MKKTKIKLSEASKRVGSTNWQMIKDNANEMPDDKDKSRKDENGDCQTSG